MNGDVPAASPASYSRTLGGIGSRAPACDRPAGRPRWSSYQRHAWSGLHMAANNLSQIGRPWQFMQFEASQVKQELANQPGPGRSSRAAAGRPMHRPSHG
jgi:hypothetical protein